MAMFLTACAAGLTVGAGCEIYKDYRLNMPGEPVGASSDWIRWFNTMDEAMFNVCGGKIG